MEEQRQDPQEEEFDGDAPEEDDPELRALLRGALRGPGSEGPQSDVLRGVQDKIRARSAGKFYADGWSTARHPPTMTYLWTAVVMIVIALASYAVLASLVGEVIEVHNEPAPVQIIAPKPR